ncbi:MAG: ATP-binding protein [Candidatus Micrarchaeota archaeon]
MINIKTDLLMIAMNINVKAALFDYNPFWTGSFEFPYRERTIYSTLAPFIKEKQIVSLCGLRRVGKTTILKKIISNLIKDNVNPTDILYFSFDDFPSSEPREVIDVFREIHGKEPKFVFFDEVQKVNNWAGKIKILYDVKGYKIFVSGSESLFLRKGAGENLAGRIFEFEVRQLSFYEYLHFIEKGSWLANMKLFERELTAALNDYLLISGFPELIGKKDEVFIRQYLRSLLEKVIFSDMPALYSIDEPKNLVNMLDVLIDRPGMLVDFVSLSQELGISRQTLSKYFEFLEAAHLIIKVYNYSANRLTSEKKLKKFYPVFLSSALSHSSNENYLSKVVEAVCVISSGAKFFWRDVYKNEVDIILLQNNKILPVEIKYSSHPEPKRGLQRFCKKYACKRALVVTKNTRKTEKTYAEVKWIPVFEFLLNPMSYIIPENHN